MRRTLAIVVAIAVTACRPARSVKVGWDAPDVPPAGYRILVDDAVVMDIPPPSLDRECQCLSATVSVPRGRHTVAVVAYNHDGHVSPPSAVLVVQ